jgi:hypothetical protein
MSILEASTRIFVDEDKLDTDAAYRSKYFAKCTDFSTNEIQFLQQHASDLFPLIESSVATAFDRALNDDSAKRFLMSRIPGYEGPIVSDIDELSMHSPIMIARVKMFSGGLYRIFCSSWDDNFIRTLAERQKRGQNWGNESTDTHPIYNECFQYNLRTELTKCVLECSSLNDRIRLVLAINKVLSILYDMGRISK